MKRTLFFIFFVLSISLILVGCIQNQDSLLQSNPKQGFTGLEISFLPNAPPEQIYASSNFKIIVELENNAAYDLTGGEVQILGIDKKYFDVFPLEENLDTLKGRSLTNPAGDKTFVEFPANSGNLFLNAERITRPFQVKATYASEVEFSDTICINPNLLDVYDAGCAVETPKYYSGQGAPVAVTMMDEIISPGSAAEVEFRFTIENKGPGKMTSLKLNNARLGNNNLNCNKQEFDLKQQSVILLCRKKSLEEPYSYTTTLFLSLNYEYEQRETSRLILVK